MLLGREFVWHGRTPGAAVPNRREIWRHKTEGLRERKSLQALKSLLAVKHQSQRRFRRTCGDRIQKQARIARAGMARRLIFESIAEVEKVSNSVPPLEGYRKDTAGRNQRLFRRDDERELRDASATRSLERRLRDATVGRTC
jgi:hypothetical protein